MRILKFISEKIKPSSFRKVGNKLMVSSWYLQIYTTIYFLIKEGWHVRATSEAERICDNAFLLMFGASLVLYVFAFISYVDENVR